MSGDKCVRLIPVVMALMQVIHVTDKVHHDGMYSLWYNDRREAVSIDKRRRLHHSRITIAASLKIEPKWPQCKI